MEYIYYLQISVENPPTMAIINNVNKLLKIFSGFILAHPPLIYLIITDFSFRFNDLHQSFWNLGFYFHHMLQHHKIVKIFYSQVIKYSMSMFDRGKDLGLTILSKSSPPVTNSKTINILLLLPITYRKIDEMIRHAGNQGKDRTIAELPSPTRGHCRFSMFHIINTRKEDMSLILLQGFTPMDHRHYTRAHTHTHTSWS